MMTSIFCWRAVRARRFPDAAMLGRMGVSVADFGKIMGVWVLI